MMFLLTWIVYCVWIVLIYHWYDWKVAFIAALATAIFELTIRDTLGKNKKGK